MKRDMDLARQILFAIEESNQDPIGWISIKIPDRDARDVSYHVQILSEAGLIEARDLSSKSGYEWKPTRLTWYGHEFLDAARSDTLWERAKALTLKETGGLSLDFLKATLIQLGMNALGLKG